MLEEASKAVQEEEAIKQKLCDDLNSLVCLFTSNWSFSSKSFVILVMTVALNRFKKARPLNFQDWRS